MAKREARVGYLSLLPAFIAIAVFVEYPILNTVFHSFTTWDGVSSEFIGFENYLAFFRNGEIWLLLRNNLIFLLSIPGILLISLIVTVLLYEEVKGWKFFRSVYYLPTILSTVIIGFLMKSMFSPSGVTNTILEAVGLESWIADWFNDVPKAFMILIFCYYWQTLGQGTLIFLAGMSTVSNEVFEAAQIDGAGWWRRLIYIILPSLVPAIFYFTVTNVIYVFIGLFGLVYSVTSGGPGYETTPIDYMIYLQGFQSGHFGSASALSVILCLIVLSIVWVQIKLSRKFDE